MNDVSCPAKVYFENVLRLQAKLSISLFLAERAGVNSAECPAADPGDREGAERPETGHRDPERELIL